jgi:hypothetical protein
MAGLLGPFVALAGAHEMRRAQVEGPITDCRQDAGGWWHLGHAAIAGAMWWTIVGLSLRSQSWPTGRSSLADGLGSSLQSRSSQLP